MSLQISHTSLPSRSPRFMKYSGVPQKFLISSAEGRCKVLPKKILVVCSYRKTLRKMALPGLNSGGHWNSPKHVLFLIVLLHFRCSKIDWHSVHENCWLEKSMQDISPHKWVSNTQLCRFCVYGNRVQSCVYRTRSGAVCFAGERVLLALWGCCFVDVSVLRFVLGRFVLWSGNPHNALPDSH